MQSLLHRMISANTAYCSISQTFSFFRSFLVTVNAHALRASDDRDVKSPLLLPAYDLTNCHDSRYDEDDSCG